MLDQKARQHDDRSGLMQNVSRRRLMAVLGAVAALLMGIAASALAAGSTLSLEVKGQYAKQHHKACHKNKPNWRAFHRASTIEYRGFLLPPPASHYTVRIKIEKCVSGRWKEVHDYFLLGQNATDKHPGRYKAFYPAKPFAPRAGRHHHQTIALAR